MGEITYAKLVGAAYAGALIAVIVIAIGVWLLAPRADDLVEACRDHGGIAAYSGHGYWDGRSFVICDDNHIEVTP